MQVLHLILFIHFLSFVLVGKKKAYAIEKAIRLSPDNWGEKKNEATVISPE